jgi:hypothetical protein
MAASGSTPLSLYYSPTASNVPLAANLVAGELALNTADGKLFYKDSAGNVQTIASKAGNVNVSSFSGGTTGLTPNTATTGAVTLAGTLAVANGGTGVTTSTGTGSTVLSTSPTLVTPILGTPTSATLTNATGLPLTTGVTGVLPTANGGTNISTYTTGDTLYASASNTLSKLPIGSTGQILSVVAGVPAWTAAPASGASITNDTTTATNLYPLFSNATTGAPTTIYTSNAKYLYKPSTGDLSASQVVASNGIVVNSATVSASYTIATGNNAMSVGPVSVASGQSVTVSSGQRWVIL